MSRHVSKRRYMKLTMLDIKRIRELRYEDGLSIGQTVAIIGCHQDTVRKYAPGWPGKVPNDKLRAAFLQSGRSASEVARRLDWWCSTRSGKERSDTSRVRRTLGLTPDINGTGRRSHRTLIDAETAERIAEAVGVAAWEIMPDVDANAPDAQTPNFEIPNPNPEELTA